MITKSVLEVTPGVFCGRITRTVKGIPKIRYIGNTGTVEFFATFFRNREQVRQLLLSHNSTTDIMIT